MNAPLIPKPRKKHVCEIEKEIRKQYERLIRGHKIDTVRAAERLHYMTAKLVAEAHAERAKNELFRPHVKLIEPHPVWNTGKTLPNRVDRVVRF